MKSKFYCMVAAATVAVSAMTCAASAEEVSVSAKSVLEEMSHALDGTSSFGGTLEAGLKASINLETGTEEEHAGTTEVPLDVSVSAAFESVVNGNGHIDGDIKVVSDLMEEEVRQPFEVYTDGQSKQIYVNTGSGWLPGSSMEAPREAQGTDMSSILDAIMESAGLQLEETKLDGKDVYEVSGSIGWDDINSILSYTGETAEDIDIDTSGADISASMFIDKETYYPVLMELGYTAEGGNNVEARDTELSIGSFTLALEMSSYDSIDVVNIPEEVSGSANISESGTGMETETETEGLVTELGSPDGKHKASFVAYGNFTESYSDDNCLSLYDGQFNEGSPDIKMYFSSNGDAAGAAEENRQSNQDFYCSQDGSYDDAEVTGVEAAEIDGHKAYWFRCSYTDTEIQYSSSTYYVYVELDEGTSLRAEVSATADTSARLDLDDDTFFDIIGHITIE